MAAHPILDRLAISIVNLPSQGTYCIMVSHVDIHALLPWTYLDFAEAEQDAVLIHNLLVNKGMIEKTDQPALLFDIPKEDKPAINSADDVGGKEANN